MSGRTFLCDCGLEVPAYEQRVGGLDRPPGRDSVWEQHMLVHRARKRRFKEKGVTPRPKEHRDHYLLWAKEELARTSCLATQQEGAEHLVDWGYNESLAANADSDAYLDHPSRDMYAAQMDLEALLPEEIARRLRRLYGSPAPEPLIDADGIWHPSRPGRRT